MYKRASSITILLTLLLTVAFTAVGSTTAVSASAAKVPTVAQSIFNFTNISRKNNGRKALNKSSCLTSFAQTHAQRQARLKSMFHQDLGPIMRKCKLRSVGENVAAGYPSASSVHKAWLNSSGHRANILSSHYRGMGVGVATAKDGTRYYAVVFGQAM